MFKIYPNCTMQIIVLIVISTLILNYISRNSAQPPSSSYKLLILPNSLTPLNKYNITTSQHTVQKIYTIITTKNFIQFNTYHKW